MFNANLHVQALSNYYYACLIGTRDTRIWGRWFAQLSRILVTQISRTGAAKQVGITRRMHSIFRVKSGNEIRSWE